MGELAARRVQAFVHPDNAASIRLVERLGFRCEGGPLADYWCVGDSYRSAMLYAFLATPGTAMLRGSPRAASGKARPRKADRTES